MTIMTMSGRRELAGGDGQWTRQQDPPPRRSWPVWLRSLLAALAGTGLLCLLAFHPGSAPRWRRSECANHLRQIALALHDYHQVYGCLPPAHVDGPGGKPMHSWRVLILPFLHYDELYRQYDFAEPWDGPKNSLLAKAHSPRVSLSCGAGGEFPGHQLCSGCWPRHRVAGEQVRAIPRHQGRNVRHHPAGGSCRFDDQLDGAARHEFRPRRDRCESGPSPGDRQPSSRRSQRRVGRQFRQVPSRQHFTRGAAGPF